MVRIRFSRAVATVAVVITCLGVVCTAQQAAAALLAHESFSYGTDTELTGKAGGTGFAGAWETGPGNISMGMGGTAGLSGDNMSLIYPAGTLLSSSGSRFRAQQATSDNDFIRLLSMPINMATDGVHYFSYLGNKQDLSTSADFMIVGFNSNEPIDQFASQTQARAAEIGWGSGDNILMATHPGEGGAYGSNTLTGKQIDKDMLMVLRITSKATGPDEVSSYIFSAAAGDPFPDIVSNEPTAGTWLITRTMDSAQTLDRIRIMTGTNLGGQIDEIRYGTNWADVVAPDPSAQPQVFTWNHTAAGDWANTSNWLPSGVLPNGNHEVVFGSSITNPSTVYTDANVTVRTMTFDSATAYGIAGQGTITLNKGTRANAAISVMQGAHEIQASLNVVSPLTIQAAAGTTLDINNSVNIDTNTVTVSGAGTVNFNGEVRGGGSIASSATLGTAGATTITGNLSSTGTLAVDIFGNQPWSFDSFDVNGAANLGGTLSVDVHDGYTPSGTFAILTADSLVNNGLILAGPDAGLFNLNVNTTTGVVSLVAATIGLVGDYNGNSVVDAADYVVWRETLGETGDNLTADGNNNNQIDTGDYQIWRQNFGMSGSAAAATSASVPEPGIFTLASIAVIGVMTLRRRNGK